MICGIAATAITASHRHMIGPNSEATHAEPGKRIRWSRRTRRRDNGLAERVKRAGADVAIDDADTAEKETGKACGGMRLAMSVGRGRFRRGGRRPGCHGKSASIVHCTI